MCEHRVDGEVACWLRVSRVVMSDLLVMFSVLSDYKGAVDEAVYEEIDNLGIPKEDLLGSTGVCLCLALLGPLVVSLVSSSTADPTSAPGSRRRPCASKAARWGSPEHLCVLSSLHIPGTKPVPAFPLSLEAPMGVGRSVLFLYDDFVHLRVPVR